MNLFCQSMRDLRNLQFVVVVVIFCEPCSIWVGPAKNIGREPHFVGMRLSIFACFVFGAAICGWIVVVNCAVEIAKICKIVVRVDAKRCVVYTNVNSQLILSITFA